MPTIDETIAFIKNAHAGQTTKSGEPYWTHPVGVMELLPATASDDERHAALLHDVIEDCGIAEDDLRAAGYSENTIEIVKLVTRPTGAKQPSYMDWIRSIAASGNAGAIRVKLADNKHNSLPERIAMLPPEERDIAKRYERSMKILRACPEAICC